MTTTTETEGSTPTPTTTATPSKSKVAAVKADSTKAPPETATTQDKPVKTKGDPASYLAIAMSPTFRAQIDGMAKAEGVSSAAIVRRAVLAQFSAQGVADAVTSGKVDQVQAGLDAVLGKLKQLDKAIDAALADTVRVADRLARVTSDKG